MEPTPDFKAFTGQIENLARACTDVPFWALHAARCMLFFTDQKNNDKSEKLLVKI